MAIPPNINKDHLLKAIKKIDLEGIPSGSDSKYYDLVYNNNFYPPKLVVSFANIFANGVELDRSSFEGGLKTPCFNLLEKNNFIIMKKDHSDKTHPINVWVEKTLVKNKQHRIVGDAALGKILWSPQKDKGKADIYSNMRKVQEGDIVLHLVDNKGIVGVSVVSSSYQEVAGIKGTGFNGPAYKINLKDFQNVEILNRENILKESNRKLLDSIRFDERVFYNKKLDLNQGAYLTKCPLKLAYLINESYYNIYKKNLPHLSNLIENIGDYNDDKFDINIFLNDTVDSNLQFSEGLIARFISSLLTKPFVILTGLSGSGKTKLAQAFASWICENDNQYCIVPVGADWTNREPLLGFPNALDTNEYIQPQNGALNLIINANKNQDKPYFLILDEMNLSHVERYFADFLSAMESNSGIELHSKDDLDSVPRKIELPSNLFIIGTVNIDETTYMFSPKVLDRANVIEFRVTAEEMSTYLNNVGEVNLKTLAAQGSNMAAQFVSLAKQKVASAAGQDEIKEPMLAFFKELKKTGSEFGYRSAAEILRFVSMAQMIKPDWDLKEIFDAAIMQKLLPKVHGSRKKLAPVLESLGNLCLKKDIKIADVFDAKIETDYAAVSLYPISLEKIARMYGNLMDNGFTSYAEA